MTPTAIASTIATFTQHLFADVGQPQLRHQILSTKPVKVRVGVTVEGYSPELLKQHLQQCNFSEAWSATFPPSPNPTHGGLNPKSIAISADNTTLLFDLIFLGVTLATEDDLK